jgi:hypothetical protein
MRQLRIDRLISRAAIDRRVDVARICGAYNLDQFSTPAVI